MSNEKEEAAWMIISLLLCGEADQHEKKQFLELAASDPQLNEHLAVIKACWKNRRAENQAPFEVFFYKLLERLRP